MHSLLSLEANDVLYIAPLHSSGPVGDSHSIPFSPMRYAWTPANSQIFCFKWIIARTILFVNTFSQLKFLYPLKTLVFPAFSPPRFGPFPSFFPLREEMRETFFRPSLQPYPVALRKFAWPLWWRGRKCSSWYLHQNVPAAPAHPWVLPRGREGWSYMYASTDGSENHPYPRSSFGSIGTHC